MILVCESLEGNMTGVASSTKGGLQTENPTILLLEDEARVRKVMGEVLSTEGYPLLEFATAEHALAHPQLNLGKLTVLITVVMLPGKTGRQLARDLQERLPGIKTILVLGYSENVA